MTRLPRIQCSLIAALLAACASPSSTSGGEGGGPVLVRLSDYKGGARFELASESHTDRIAYYSDERSDAARKVQTDEVMSAFLRALEEQGLAEHARAGRAPSVEKGGVIRWGLEIEGPGKTLHWLVGTGSPASDWQQFQACRDTFLQLYNATVSYQTVQNESGKQYFDDRARAASDRKSPR